METVGTLNGNGALAKYVSMLIIKEDEKRRIKGQQNMYSTSNLVSPQQTLYSSQFLEDSKSVNIVIIRDITSVHCNGLDLLTSSLYCKIYHTKK